MRLGASNADPDVPAAWLLRGALAGAFTLLGASCLPSATRGPAMGADAWAALKREALAGLEVAPGWRTPEHLPPPINTPGWEDSAWISPDGNRLYLQYLPGDLFRIDQILHYHRPTSQGGLGADPARRDEFHRGPGRGVEPPYTSDSFSFRNPGPRPEPPERFEYSIDGRNEWGIQGEGDAVLYVSHDPAREMNRDLFRGARRLPIPGAERYHEDNPHFVETAYGHELFFDNDDRPASEGRSRIWVSLETESGFSEPTLLAAPVNLPGSTENQPHLTPDGTLYFASSRGDVIAIWASARRGRNEWDAPNRVVWPGRRSGPRIWGVGEPTLTADGRWLYFVALFTNDRGEFDSDVMRVERFR